MRLSAQEEYGLRCLLHLAGQGEGKSLTIPEISRAEGLSVPNVAKLMRILRMGGIVRSTRGQSGGYTLARPASEISVGAALNQLGGPLYGPEFCVRHSGRVKSCTHAHDCSLRPLWSTIQMVLEEVLEKTSLQDLLCNEQEMTKRIEDRAGGMLPWSTGAASTVGTGESH